MDVKFKSIGTIKSRLGIQRYGPAHKYLAERSRQHMNAKYVPEGSTKVLVTTSFITNNCEIVYPQIYAQFQYYGKLMIDPVTKSAWARKGVKKELTNTDLKYKKPGAGPYWDRQMKSADMKSIKSEVQEYVKRGCK